MKKAFYAIALTGLMGFACSGEPQKTTDMAAAEPVAMQNDAGVDAEAAVEKVADGKVMKMTTAQFINKIFDYKNNNQWVYKGDKPVIIDFYADWCGPCKRVAPIMDELAAEYAGEIEIYKVDTDVEQELAAVFGVRSIPSILYIPAEGQPAIYPGAFPKAHYQDQIVQHFQIEKKQL